MIRSLPLLSMVVVFSSLMLSLSTAQASNGSLSNDSLYDAYKKSMHDSPPRYLAQSESEDSFDPFADYSEFDDSGDEESDINFFRHGRFLTLGFQGGMRGFTESLAEMYASGPSYGIFLCFFFDMRLAIQMGILTGDHGFQASGPTKKVEGNASLTMVNIDVKYYFNTQNVTRGLADLNPYILGGISQVHRTVSLAGSEFSGKDSTMGLNLGAGIELAAMKKKGFLGLQASYRYIPFADETKPLQINLAPPEDATLKPAGDSIDFLLIWGFNY